MQKNENTYCRFFFKKPFRFLTGVFLFIFCSCFFGAPQQLFSQDFKVVDSLLNIAVREKNNGTASLRAFMQAARILEKSDSENAKKYLTNIYLETGKIYEKRHLHENALEYYRKANNIAGNQGAKLLVASSLFELKKYEDALEAYWNALQEVKESGKIVNELALLAKVVLCYEKLGMFDEALEVNFKILEAAQINKLKEEELIALNNIGYIYRFLKNYPKAADILLKSLRLQTELKKSQQAQITTLVNLGVVYQNTGNYSASLENLIEALQLAKKSNLTAKIAEIRNIIAKVYLNGNDIYNAETHNEAAKDYAEKAGDSELLAKTLLTKSEILQAKEDYQTALNYYRQHLALRDSIMFKEMIAQHELMQQQFFVEREEKKTLDQIATDEAKKAELDQIKSDLENQKIIAEKKAQLEKAEAERAKAEELKQKSAKELAEKELLILKQEREARNRQAEILALEKEKVLQDLELEKQRAQEFAIKEKLEQAQKDKEIQDLRSKSQNLEIARREKENQFLYLIVFLVLISALLAVYALFNVRKKNKLLAEQKNEISLKNAELEITQEELKSQRDALADKTTELNGAYNNIKASINYAKRIQTAILPPLSGIQKFLPESFIFFKPRDIVSGDFYWFSETQDGGAIIAAVDCTGHGVPGAFMSMIGDSLFNQAVIEKEIYSPDLILAELDRGIRSALRKGEQYAKDGMDLSVCYLSPDKKYVLFGGAMNPISYVQNGELTEIKADKRAIGGEHSENYLFNMHRIDITSPTHFYLYSDGFQDQFGGKENKKFMTKRFRELLLNIHHEEMNVQKDILEKTITDWIGTKNSQLDDILVIGFTVGK